MVLFLWQALCIRLLHMHEWYFMISLSQVICFKWLAIRVWEFLQFPVPFPWSITQSSVCTPLLLSALNSEVWELWDCRPLWLPALRSVLYQVCLAEEVASGFFFFHSYIPYNRFTVLFKYYETCQKHVCVIFNTKIAWIARKCFEIIFCIIFPEHYAHFTPKFLS